MGSLSTVLVREMKHHLLSLTSEVHPRYGRYSKPASKETSDKRKDSVKAFGAWQHLRIYPNKAANVLVD